MNTYIHTKTGKRYPENGYECVTPSLNGRLWVRGRGELSKKESKLYKSEAIPDLEKPFTREQFIAYVAKYGMRCAQEFLECADICKSSYAYRIINHPKNQELWEKEAAWFQTVFHRSLWDFMDRLMISMGNIYSLDVLHIEKHLQNEFSYPIDEDGSLSDFITTRFGADVAARVRALISGPSLDTKHD